MKTFTGPGRPLNPDDPLDPTFNPDEEPSYPEADPEDVPMPDQPLYVPPAITPMTMYQTFTAPLATVIRTGE